jgi:hypothetical protein
MRGNILPIALASVLAGGCAVDENISTEENPAVIPNGIDLNGIDLNGIDLNGIDLNGERLGNTVVSTSFDNAWLNGAPLYDSWLEGSELVALGWHHDVTRGTGVAGMYMFAVSDTHHDLLLRVSDVDAPDAGDDVWHYWVDLWVPPSKKSRGGWAPICEDAGGNPEPTIAVAGYWNYKRGIPHGGDHVDSSSSFTFACPSSGAIGKCVVLGYKPWASADGVPLEELHEGCTRLLRADYCGDGVPHTVNGALVDLYDGYGVQDDAADWRAEAEWDSNGARCVSDHIRAALPVRCYREKFDPTCGNPPDWDGGTLLVTETP